MRWWHESFSPAAYDGISLRRAGVGELQRSTAASDPGRAAELYFVPAGDHAEFESDGASRRIGQLGAPIQHFAGTSTIIGGNRGGGADARGRAGWHGLDDACGFRFAS